MDGFKRALEKNQIELTPEYLISEKMTISGGYEGAKHMMELENPPTALFCANYEITLGAIIAINESGVKIPNDLSVIGFDNLMLAQVVQPTLTMIVQPMREIAENAAQMMLDRLESQKTGGIKTIELSASMTRGHSVRNMNSN